MVVDGDAEGPVRSGAAEIRRVHERRIDHERIARLVGADLEGIGGRPEELEPPGDRDALGVDLLVDRRRALPELAEGRLDHERAILGDTEAFDPPIRDANPARIAARFDDELLLQMAAVAVEPEVDPGPDLAIDHLGVGPHSGPPPGGVVPEVVVVGAGEELFRFDRRA